MTEDGKSPPPVDSPVSTFAVYSDLFEKMLDSVALIDINSFKILDANPSFERLLGQEREELLGRCLSDWVGQDQQNEFMKFLRIAKRSYYPRQASFKWHIKGGKVLKMELLACTMHLSNQIEVVQIIGHDVTALHELQAKADSYLKDLQAANERLHKMSLTDAMTGLSNFRHFKQLLEQEHIRSSRYDGSYALIFMDLDHFKKYNDMHGHPAGDALLRQLADVIRRTCRNTDYPARYGGEEFVVICPETPPEGAKILADRLRIAVEQEAFPHREEQPLKLVSVSVGVASFPEDAKEFEALVQCADEAVYASKKNGRNLVTFYSDLRRAKLKLAG